MRRLGKSLSKPDKGEQGQIVMLTAFVLVVVLGFAALAIDLGFFAETKRDSQNDADAMALSGVQGLALRGLSQNLREANAQAIAEDWADLNDVDMDEIASIEFGTTCEGDSVPDTITVRLEKTRDTFLAAVMGVGSLTSNVCATARTGMARGGPGLLPIGLLYTNPSVPGGVCYYDSGSGSAHSNFYYNPSDGTDLTYADGGADELCVIKIRNPSSGDTWASGNTGPIRLDDSSNVDPDNYDPDCDPAGSSSGNSEYQEGIEEGSECPYAYGDNVQPLTGSAANPTCTSFGIRLTGHMSSVHAGHDITDVFMNPIQDSSGNWLYRRVDESNPHFGIIPVITTPSGGSSGTVQIIRFVTVYVVGCGETGNGNDKTWTVSIIPVNSQYFVEGQEIVEPGESGYTSDWPAYTIKLIE